MTFDINMVAHQFSHKEFTFVEKALHVQWKQATYLSN